MLIDDFSITPYEFMLTRPYWAGDTHVPQRNVIILDLISRKGYSGQGESAPLAGISVVELSKVHHQLKYLAREWTGRSLPDTLKELCSRLRKDLDHALLEPSVIFAVESAVMSLAASERGISIAQLLGGTSPKTVESACLIQGDLKAVQAYGCKYAAEGFSVFKLKVGSSDIQLDIQKVEALREVISFDSKIRLDANAAWSLSEAVAFASVIGKDRIDFMEAPCANENDYEKFFQRSDLPLAIEAYSNHKPWCEWEGILGLSAIVVKPMLCGGITGFLDLKEIARKIGARLIVSSICESAVGFKILANLAALTDEICELGTAGWTEGEHTAIFGKGGLILPAQLM